MSPESRGLNLKDAGDGIILIPQPSDDVNDPLNWPKWEKLTVFLPVVFFAALGNWVIAAPGSGILLMEKEFHTGLSQTSNGVVTWSVFTLGIGVTLQFR